MKTKNKAKIVGLMALVLVVGIGATLAYFTDSKVAANILPVGHVDISLKEEMTDPDNQEGPKIPYEDPLNLAPGDVISKVPSITVEKDSLESYVRGVVTITSPRGVNPAISIANLDIGAEWVIMPDKKVENSWYCYYIGGEREGIVMPGETVYVFTQAELPGEWQNEVNGQQIAIDVQAEAIQADNFTPTYERKNGKIVSCVWMDEDKKEVEAQVYKKAN